MKWGFAAQVRVLVKAGADPDARDEEGKSARELAVGEVRTALEAGR